jgi:hypothetical protein
MDEQQARMEAEEPFDFASLFSDDAEAAGVEEQAPVEQEQERRSLASSLFEKLKSIVSAPAQQEQQEQQEQAEAEQTEAEDEAEEEVPFGEEEAAPQPPAISDAEIEAAASTVVSAIRNASDALGLEISDEHALEIALSVLAQAASLEQAELLIFGTLLKEAQKQGIGVKRQQTREYEGNTEDTLDLFVRLAS